MHHAEHRHSTMKQCDQRAPDRKTCDEGFCAVDGIQHPDIFGVFVLIAEFLADDAVLRKVRLDHPAHYGLGRPIGLRYRIEVAIGALAFAAEKSRSEKWQDGFARGRRETV